MAESHEIWDGLDVHQPSVNLDWCTWGCDPNRVQVDLKKKIGADGQVETYKARLVAKDFR